MSRSVTVGSGIASIFGPEPGDWKRGDNLYTYFTLINESLANKN